MCKLTKIQILRRIELIRVDREVGWLTLVVWEAIEVIRGRQLMTKVGLTGHRLGRLDLARPQSGDGGGLGLDEGEQGEGVRALVTGGDSGHHRELAGPGSGHGHWS